ncbi:MAG: 4-oxalocrotonate tautomerase [Candidatus Azotimanducaceae bacterium]|jgi:4-oxalocrotonate tautomerase
MPIIRVEMFKGRTAEQKSKLVSELTKGFIKTCGGDPKGLAIVITEVETENWGVSGELVSDIHARKNK